MDHNTTKNKQREFMTSLKQIISEKYTKSNRSINTRWMPDSLKQDIIEATSFAHENENFSVRCHFILHDIFEPILCRSCGKNFPQQKYESKFKQYCSHECVNKDHKRHLEKRKQTCLEKYGVENPMMNDIIAAKCQQRKEFTVSQKYGVNNVFQLDSTKEKIKNTYKKNFGVSHPMQLSKIREKQQQTILDKYGKKNVSQSHIENKHLEILADPKTLEEMYSKYGVKKLCDVMNITEMTLRKYLKGHGVLDDYSNSYQNLITSWLDEMGVEYRINDRSMIRPKEIDIVIPEFKLGIEINGDFWHSEQFGKDYQYHISKTVEANKKGFDLLHIATSQLDKNPHLIKSMIAYRTNNITTRYQARKLEIKHIDDNYEYDLFLERNHLKGANNASIKIGLFDDKELLAVMSFSKSRFNKNFRWELMRYATKANCVISGGASKLFRYFLKNYTGTIISYADRNISNGKLYRSLGFNFSHFTSPGYSYIKNDKIYNRCQFQKHKLKDKLKSFDCNLSERENMLNNGYYRIWNTGNSCWIYVR